MYNVHCTIYTPTNYNVILILQIMIEDDERLEQALNPLEMIIFKRFLTVMYYI